MTKAFPFREIMQSLPKKALKGLQEKHGKLLGLVQLVVTYENEQSRAGVTTYLMNISNRPSDLMRISTGHSWDMGSCMRLGENPNRYVYKEHNIAVNGYIDFRSYVAYLTKESPYEPKWYARIQMHRCHDSDNTPLISVQHSSLGYDVGGNYHAYSDILNEAITVAFSEKGLNDKCTGRCKHYWADPGVTNRRGYTYHDYTDNGGKCVKYSLEKSDVKDILRRRTRGTNKPSDFVKQVSTTF
jgi:hypothetical protein